MDKTHPVTVSKTITLLFLIFFSISGFIAAESAEKPVKVFILSGQSNGVGMGCGDKLSEEYKQPDPDLMLFCNGGNWKGMAPLAPYPSYPDLADMYACGDTMFGPEVAFGHEMRKLYPDHRILIVKCCVGGTSILSWSKDFGSEQNQHLMTAVGYKNIGKQKNLYARLIEDIREALSAIGHPYEVSAFLWVQAERDSGHPDAARDWARRVTQLHRDLAEEIGYSPDIPLLVMGPHFHLFDKAESEHKAALISGIRKVAEEGGPVTPERLKTAAGLETLAQKDLEKELGNLRYWPPDCYTRTECVGIMNRGLREEAARLPNLAVVQSDDLPTHEGLHFDTEGQIELGKRFAHAYTDKIGPHLNE